MIATITSHDRDTTAVLVHAGPELATTMGGFAPARFNRDRRAYLLAATYLEAFTRWAEHEGITVVDERRPAAQQPTTWTPAHRHTAPPSVEYLEAKAALVALNRDLRRGDNRPLTVVRHDPEPTPDDGWDTW